MLTRPVALSIAGSDCSAGAGIQADLKTFEAFHVHGVTAVTCVVAETAATVRGIFPISPEFLAAQVALLLEELPVAAIKTGMLYSAAHIEAILPLLAAYPEIPLIVDPVMLASTGDSLTQADFLPAMLALLARAHLVTPNLDEARALLGKPISLENFRAAAVALTEKFAVPFLLKGGHLGTETCTDLLVESALNVQEFSSPRLVTHASHGTGCTLSAAIAAGLAQGKSLSTSVANAKHFLNQSLAESYQISPTLAALHQSNSAPNA